MTTEDTTTTAADALARALAGLQESIRVLPPEVREQRRREAENYAQRQDEERARSLLNDSKAPLRQLNSLEIDRTGLWGIAETKIAAKLGNGCFIALVGIRGCGKTQLGVEAIRLSTSKGRRARYCTATEFFMEIKAAYSKGRSEKEVLDEFHRPALLVIDEIGQRSESEWENRLLFELLNRRYNALKDTVLISNQTAETFSKSIGPSLISRMQETGGLIQCDWPSYRQ